MTTVRHQLTHESLLERMQNLYDTEAWDRFYATYRGLILSYARRKGCTDQMAQDVLQETLITLTRKMPTFRYDRMKGRFRGFLLMVVKSRIIDAYRREKKHVDMAFRGGGDGDALTVAGENVVNDWETEWDREWEHNLLMQALNRVRDRISRHIYESFRLYVLERKSADHVSAALDIPKDNIYEHRRRVISMLRDEVAAIRRDMGE